jgi:hypothetical protein
VHQLLLGASVPYVIGLAAYLLRRRRVPFAALLLWPLSMALSMLWAVAPDIPRVLGNGRLYARLAFEPRCDIFYWHYSIDLTESDSPWFVVPFALVWASLLFIAWRELRLAEAGEE